MLVDHYSVLNNVQTISIRQSQTHKTFNSNNTISQNTARKNQATPVTSWRAEDVR